MWVWKVLWKSKKTRACLIFTTCSIAIGARYWPGANDWEFCPLPFLIYRRNKDL